VELAFTPHSLIWLLLAELDGVEELYVVPAARRRRVATAFLAYLLTEGRRRGVRAVELEVLPTQTAAFALYRARGFHDVHRQRMTWDLS
jgi:ribosomal protein S18 acetylase RimI-like enzyme